MAISSIPALVQFGLLEPVSALALPAPVWAYAVLLATVSTVLSWVQALGGLLVISGVLLVSMKRS